MRADTRATEENLNLNLITIQKLKAKMNAKLRQIANSFAEEYGSDAIYPAHLFKAILHKEIGLVRFLETELGKDYYYLQDWADVQMQLSPRAVRPMRDLEYSGEIRPRRVY